MAAVFWTLLGIVAAFAAADRLAVACQGLRRPFFLYSPHGRADVPYRRR
jgi:hypothetical protein